MKKLLIAIAASLILTSCSSTKCIQYYNDGQIAAVYTDDVFIGTFKDLGLGFLWNYTFRIPCSFYGPPGTYWNPRGPVPTPRNY